MSILDLQYLIKVGIGHTLSDSSVAEIGVSYTRRYCADGIAYHIQGTNEEVDCR